jgi:NAD(P)-dependent dehydrogenase (short-subunit alcohol dehydrogenase family)
MNLPSLAGKVALVTGANRGLGLEIAAGLAAAGATVVLACRDAGKAESAVQEIRRRVPAAKLETIAVDLAELASIRRFAQEVSARFPKLDLLVNNASAILVPYGKTRDGFETHIGVNHLGTFALTGLLLDRLRGGGRIVSTSSLAHKMTKGLDLADLHFERTPYKDMDAYGRSKLATLLFTFELNRRLQQARLPVLAAAAHPGWSNTNPDQGSFFMRLMNRLMAQSAAAGALPALYAATMPDVQGGEYFGPGGMAELRGAPKRVQPRPEARDATLAAQLWALSENLTGERYLDRN